jgi:hypothetical protein
MLYIICKAKNEVAMNEHNPVFNTENWEVLETVQCRKNASMKTYNSIFSPIYQRLTRDKHECIRLWNFKEEEII